MVENNETAREVYIPSIDAKDLYLSNHYLTESLRGYDLRKSDGEYNLSRFINTADYSLDLIKLREVYEKVYRRKDFDFVVGDKRYTKRIINVTFKYSVKEYNKIYTDLYLKSGYSKSEFELIDCINIQNGELIAIQINKEVKNPLPSSVLGKFFYYDEDEKVYKAKTNIDVEVNVAELRKDLYENGFMCDGTKFIRYKRSSGSSRVGKCLFIDEKLYSQMHRWELCGLTVRKGQAVDLAGLEPSIALTLSSIIDTVTIKPENFLVIDDYESVFKEEVAATELIDGRLKTSPKEVEIANSIWDGQSLMDSSLFGNYSNYGMLLLRARFFKSCCFNTNLRQWFSDHNITEVSQLNGFTLAKSIDDVKIITTPSSIKYMKFGKLEDWLNNLDTTFGIVKHEKPTHYFSGRLVQSHYQLLNTLQLSLEETAELVFPSLDYLRQLKTDPDVLRYHIKYNLQDYDDMTALNSKNDIIYRLLGLNYEFAKTKMYVQFRDDVIKSYRKNLRKGHILINGNYSTICGNPIEMLLSSVGLFEGVSQIGKGNIHSTRFPYETDLLGSRSPHVNPGNVLVAHNVANEEIDRYFNFTEEIVVVNSMGESLLDRLSGSDFDSDTMMLTDNKILLDAAKRNYSKFLVPVKLVSSAKSKRKYTDEDKADLDIKTAVNKIGEIINLSQEINSKMWDKLNGGAAFDEVSEMYYDSCQLDVMSNLEIDSAKRENPADNVLELKELKEKYGTYINKKYVRPMFFKFLDKDKGYYDENRKVYKYYKTTMDYLQKCITSYKLPRDRFTPSKFSSILLPLSDYPGKVKYSQVMKVITEVRFLRSKMKDLRIEGERCSDPNERIDKFKQMSDLKKECVDFISKVKMSDKTMRYLLSLLDDDQCKDISRLMMNTFFASANNEVYSLIRDSKKPVFDIVEEQDGEIKLYDFSFKKV